MAAGGSTRGLTFLRRPGSSRTGGNGGGRGRGGGCGRGRGGGRGGAAAGGVGLRRRVLEAAPDGLVLVEDRQRRQAAARGVGVPAPEQRPLAIGAVALQHAEDQPVHAVEDAELEDVGAQEAPDGAAENLLGAGPLALLPLLRGAPEAVLLDPPEVLVQRIGHVVLHRVAQDRSGAAG